MLLVSAQALLLADVAALALDVALLVWVCRLWLDYERREIESVELSAYDELDAYARSLGFHLEFNTDPLIPGHPELITGYPASGESGARGD